MGGHFKHSPNSLVERLKARLVAKGYAQTYKIDYFKTFSSIRKLNLVKVLIAMATNLYWQLYQSDVRMPFYMKICKKCI